RCEEMSGKATNSGCTSSTYSSPFNAFATFNRAEDSHTGHRVCEAVIMSQSMQSEACCKGTRLNFDVFISAPCDQCLSCRPGFDPRRRALQAGWRYSRYPAKALEVRSRVSWYRIAGEVSA